MTTEFFFRVSKNLGGRFYVKAVLEDGTSGHAQPFLVVGTFDTEKDAVQAGVDAAIEWCLDHACMDDETAAGILSLF